MVREHTGLSVYGTDGEEYYPDPRGGNRHSDASTWFSNGLRLYLDTSTPELMTYLGDVRHPRRKDQAFAVYRGTDPATLFSDCQRAIRQQLVDGEGWSIVEESSVTNPRYLYHAAIENPRSNGHFESRPLAAYVSHDVELVERALRTNNSTTTVEPIEVVAADYQVAAELVHSNQDTATRIHVYNNREVTPPTDVDLVIKVEPGPYNVDIPDATRALLDRLDDQLQSHRARERSQATRAAIASHAEHNDGEEVVEDAVEAGFNEHYDGLEVIKQERRERLEADLETAETTLQKREAELETERQRVDELQRQLGAKQVKGSLWGGIAGVLGRGSNSSAKGNATTDGGEWGSGSIDGAYDGQSSGLSPLRVLAVGLAIIALVGGVAVAANVVDLPPPLGESDDGNAGADKSATATDTVTSPERRTGGEASQAGSSSPTTKEQPPTAEATSTGTLAESGSTAESSFEQITIETPTMDATDNGTAAALEATAISKARAP